MGEVPSHAEVIEDLIRQRDDARLVALRLWEFLQEADVIADARAENAGAAHGTPEFDLYVKAVVADEVGREAVWVQEMGT